MSLRTNLELHTLRELNPLAYNTNRAGPVEGQLGEGYWNMAHSGLVTLMSRKVRVVRIKFQLQKPVDEHTPIDQLGAMLNVSITGACFPSRRDFYGPMAEPLQTMLGVVKFATDEWKAWLDRAGLREK